MKKSFSNVLVNVVIAIIAVVAGISMLSSCDNEQAEAKVQPMADTVRIVKGFEVIPSLTHQWDSVKRIEVKDYMDSKLEIWRTQGGQRTEKAYDNTEHPEVLIGSLLSKQDYAITEDLVDIKPTSSTILRNSVAEKDGTTTEIDTVVYQFPDQQVWSIPVRVTNKNVTVGGHVFDFPSVTLTGHEFQYLKNHARSATRAAQYKSAEYQTEYKSMLTFKETNIESPKTLKAPIYAFTNRFVMSDDELDKVVLVDSSRVWVDQENDKCTVILDSYYKSGIKLTDTYEFMCKHLFKGRAPYEKTVQNFEHKFISSNPISWGAETSRQSSDPMWTVSGKNGVNFENISNGVAADKADAYYDYYIERPVFKKSFNKEGINDIVVDFGYAGVKVDEMQTSITAVNSDKEGMKKAEVKNFVSTNYLGGVQNLNDTIYLYTSSKDVKKIELINPEIKVYKDSVTADIDVVTELEDGTKTTKHDHFKEPRSLKVNTNWESVQEVLSQTTDKEVSVNLSGSASKERGNWHWTEETRALSDYAHLYNGENKMNGWTSVVPNKLSYTYEGKSHSFDVLSYTVKEQGAAVNMRGEEGNFTVYDYSDVIEETYGDFTQSSKAPGVIKIAKNVITGYEIRNKILTITNDNVNASCDFVTLFKDGTEDKESVKKDFPRSIVCTTNWKSSEANANEQTAQPSAKLSASQNKEDGEWTWVEQTRDITANVTLNASTQYNGWTSKDPNSIKFTRNGVTADFGKIEFKTAYVNSSALKSNTEGLTDTYVYDNTISVTFGDNTQSVSAPGTIIVNRDKEVTGHEFRNKSLVITNTDVTASLVYVTKYNDGSEDTEDVSKSFPRTLNPYTSWNVNDTNASVLTSSASVNLESSDNKKDGNWSYTAQKRNITTTAQLQSSSQTNGWNAQDPNNIKYTRDGETCDFGTINFSAAEAGQKVDVKSETSTLTTYDYTDKVTVTFGDNVQTSSAPGVINVAKAKTIVGYEITNQNMTIAQNGVTTSLTFITKWSDGSQDEENISKFFARNFDVLSDWSSNEDNANQSTSSTSVTLKNSESMTDGDWAYVRETRGITTTAQLNGSSQTNAWESKDPNSIVFSKNGQTYNFGTINFSANETGANVNKQSETADETVYSYTDNINVMFGDNSFNSSAPGQIRVSAPWNPDFDYGKFTGCVFTTAVNEERNTWVYIASVHFETGTLPLVIRKNANAPEVNKDYFENNTDSRLNSGSWIPQWNKWINTIATDTPDLMQWDTTAGANADNMAYPTATAWGWDYGYTVSGHPSVTTDKFSASISSDGYVLTIYKGGNVFATYKAAKH